MTAREAQLVAIQAHSLPTGKHGVFEARFGKRKRRLVLGPAAGDATAASAGVGCIANKGVNASMKKLPEGRLAEFEQVGRLA